LRNFFSSVVDCSTFSSLVQLMSTPLSPRVPACACRHHAEARFSGAAAAGTLRADGGRRGAASAWRRSEDDVMRRLRRTADSVSAAAGVNVMRQERTEGGQRIGDYSENCRPSDGTFAGPIRARSAADRPDEVRVETGREYD
jgi:hypothetical protein